MLYKYCVGCSTEKSISEFGVKKGSPGGVSKHCKKCNRVYYANYRKNNKEKIFSIYKKYTENNKEKIKAKKREWRKNNKEKVSEYAKRHRKLNRDALIERSRIWAENNKERIRALCSNWKKRNRDKICFYASKRKGKQIKATPKWADFEIIKNFYMEAKYQGMHVDHIIPLINPIVCGLHVEHNLQLLTKEDNLRKSNKFEV